MTEEELDSGVTLEEDKSSSRITAGAELLDSSPQATNKTAESNNATKYFTENLLEPQSFLPNLNYKKGITLVIPNQRDNKVYFSQV